MLWKQFVSDGLQALLPIYEIKEAKNILMLLLQYRKTDFQYSDLLDDKSIDEKVFPQLQKDLAKLQNGMPIQYVINECWFYRYPFFVNEYCLIPRPETEELVLRTIQQIEQLKNKPFPKILDIGTGSGCISISLKKELQHCRITSIDIFPETLKVAKRNARKLGAQIDFLLDDILHPASYVQQQCFDLIVSNPPYIPLAESVHMHKNVLDYEPHSALFVQDDAPLLFYRAIAEIGIKNKATVCCEISENLGTATVDLFRGFGYGNIVLHRDLQGKDRVIVAQGW